MLYACEMSVSTVKCEVCQEATGKYRCPRCKLVSCSLPCIKQHKEEKNCNGVRDRTAYVSLKDFDDLQLLSDYRYLEDLQRILEAKNENQLSKKLKRLTVPHKYGMRQFPRHRKQRRFRRGKKNKFSNKKLYNENTCQQNLNERSQFLLPASESNGESSTVCPSLKSEMLISWDENKDVSPMEISLKS